MIARLKSFLRRRKVARISDEIARVRAIRMDMTQKEFALRGKLAVAEASL